MNMSNSLDLLTSILDYLLPLLLLMLVLISIRWSDQERKGYINPLICILFIHWQTKKSVFF